MHPPRVIDTARLRLRQPAESDIEAIFEYGSDATVTALMDWRRLTDRSEAVGFLARTADSWCRGVEFTWVISELGPDYVVGAISLRARVSDADFGYVLNRRYWGRGYATEAAAAVVSWATLERGISRIWATCDTENHRSARVLEKMGLIREGLAPVGTIRPNICETPRDSFVYVKERNAV
jgi:[ribosomal protein S5]-alanine N-acetyltransferase